jgi:hypothetical protein
MKLRKKKKRTRSHALRKIKHDTDGTDDTDKNQIRVIGAIRGEKK